MIEVVALRTRGSESIVASANGVAAAVFPDGASAAPSAVQFAAHAYHVAGFAAAVMRCIGGPLSHDPAFAAVYIGAVVIGYVVVDNPLLQDVAQPRCCNEFVSCSDEWL